MLQLLDASSTPKSDVSVDSQKLLSDSIVNIQYADSAKLLLTVDQKVEPTDQKLKSTNTSIITAYKINADAIIDISELSNSPPTCSPLSSSITHSLFHSRLKTHLFHKSFPPQSASTHLDCLLGLYWSGLTLLKGFSFLVIFSFFFYFGSCGRLSWLNCQLSSARYYSISTNFYLLAKLKHSETANIRLGSADHAYDLSRNGKNSF